MTEAQCADQKHNVCTLESRTIRNKLQGLSHYATIPLLIAVRCSIYVDAENEINLT